MLLSGEEAGRTKPAEGPVGLPICFAAELHVALMELDLWLFASDPPPPECGLVRRHCATG